jgi:hypothetical protein
MPLGANAFEVLSAADPDGTEAALLDWFSLLDAGHALAVAGGTGAGDLDVDLPGAARTWVRAATVDEVPAAYALGRGFASTGPLLDVTVQGSGGTARPGDTLVDSDGAVTVSVTLRAAPWVPAGRVRVWGPGGALLGEATPTGGGDVRLSRTFNVAGAAWIAVDAGDPSELPGGTFNELLPGMPSYAVTAPVWVIR